MSITIELPARAEEYLRDRAAHEGEAPEAVAARLLTETLEWDAEDFVQAVEGIRRGLEDSAAGRTKPASEVFEKYRKALEAARK